MAGRAASAANRAWPRPDGGIGRRAGFRYQWWQHRGGSSPFLGSMLLLFAKSSIARVTVSFRTLCKRLFFDASLRRRSRRRPHSRVARARCRAPEAAPTSPRRRRTRGVERAEDQRRQQRRKQRSRQPDPQRAARVLLAADLGEADDAQAEPALRGKAESERQERSQPPRRPDADVSERPRQERDEHADDGRAAATRLLAEEIIA